MLEDKIKELEKQRKVIDNEIYNMKCLQIEQEAKESALNIGRCFKLERGRNTYYFMIQSIDENRISYNTKLFNKDKYKAITFNLYKLDFPFEVIDVLFSNNQLNVGVDFNKYDIKEIEKDEFILMSQKILDNWIIRIK